MVYNILIEKEFIYIYIYICTSTTLIRHLFLFTRRHYPREDARLVSRKHNRQYYNVDRPIKATAEKGLIHSPLTTDFLYSMLINNFPYKIFLCYKMFAS